MVSNRLNPVGESTKWNLKTVPRKLSVVEKTPTAGVKVSRSKKSAWGNGHCGEKGQGMPRGGRGTFQKKTLVGNPPQCEIHQIGSRVVGGDNLKNGLYGKEQWVIGGTDGCLRDRPIGIQNQNRGRKATAAKKRTHKPGRIW